MGRGKEGRRRRMEEAGGKRRGEERGEEGGRESWRGPTDNSNDYVVCTYVYIYIYMFVCVFMYASTYVCILGALRRFLELGPTPKPQNMFRAPFRVFIVVYVLGCGSLRGNHISTHNSFHYFYLPSSAPPLSGRTKSILHSYFMHIRNR